MDTREDTVLPSGAKVPDENLPKAVRANVTDITWRANALLRLLQWISQARDIFDEIRAAAQMDPGLQAKLAQYGIAFNSPEWGTEDEAFGLSLVFTQLHALLGSVDHEVDRLLDGVSQ